MSLEQLKELRKRVGSAVCTNIGIPYDEGGSVALSVINSFIKKVEADHAVAIERTQTQGLQAAASPGSERELLHEAWEILRLGHPVTHECVFVCNCTEKLIANIEVALAHPTPGSEREE